MHDVPAGPSGRGRGKEVTIRVVETSRRSISNRQNTRKHGLFSCIHSRCSTNRLARLICTCAYRDRNAASLAVLSPLTINAVRIVRGFPSDVHFTDCCRL